MYPTLLSRLKIHVKVAGRGREGWEKHCTKMASKQRSNKVLANTLCEELQANNCKQGAPAKSMGSPPAFLGKLLTSIALRLTLPKLHLATPNFVKN